MAKRPDPTRNDIRIPFEAVSFDNDAFDNLIRSHGVEIIHEAISYCVEESISPDDIRPHANHSTCSGGMSFDTVGETEGWFSSNGTSQDWKDAGIFDESKAYLTVQRFYNKRFDGHDCDCPVVFQVADRVYIKDNPIRVSNSQKFEHHQSGTDRMIFPVTSVQLLKDARGKKYRQGVDFEVTNGNIVWRPGKSPGYDPVLGRGVTCSIRYQYIPYYSVSRILHEIRVNKDVNVVTGEVNLVRGPFQLELQREWVFQNEDRAKDDENASVRDVPTVRKGGFGPR